MIKGEVPKVEKSFGRQLLKVSVGKTKMMVSGTEGEIV